MPYLGKSPSQGVRARYQFTPNAGTTSLSGADANGSTMTFTDGNYVDVYLNGVMLKAGVDYVTTTANTIGSLSATVASDVVDVIVYDTFSLFGGTLEGNVKVNNGTFNVTGATDLDSTLNVDGAMTGTSATFTVADNSTILNLVSTDADANVGPRIDITRNSASPAANDYLGQIRFMGEDAADNSLSYVSMFGQLLDPTDGGEDGSFELDVRLAGSNRSRMISNATETVFNDDSVDLDFRVESNGLTHALFVDGGNDRTVLGYSSGRVPVSVLVPHSNSAIANAMRISTHGVSGYSSSNSIGAGARLEFGQYDDGYDWVIGSIATVRTGGSWAGALTFYTNNDSASNNNTERMRIDSTGRVMIGTGGAMPLKWWNGTTMGNQFLVEKNNTTGAADYVGIGNVRNSADSEGPQLGFGKSRGTASGAVTIVNDGDALGVLTFQGGDGTNLVEGARILAAVDGTPGADDMPGRLQFYTTADGSASTTERMRITSGGDIAINNSTSIGFKMYIQSDSGQPALALRRNGGSDGELVRLHNASGTDVGSIDTSSSSTSYNTSSDHRLKENLDYDWTATTRLKQLKPVRFNFIADDTNTLVEGFLAHEAQEVVPQSVTGNKDEVDDDGNAIMQGIDHSVLVPLLVKTIQELEARIAKLEE